ncbi:hypothetical protein [Floridanema evergladense]|uniref:Uncharacterized protein n=1 Tax=Floridaenema evergladense BLCC-F167 TaxID=3153639 RepID=A0ABV4WV62_9CYAN
MKRLITNSFQKERTLTPKHGLYSQQTGLSACITSIQDTYAIDLRS